MTRPLPKCTFSSKRSSIIWRHHHHYRSGWRLNVSNDGEGTKRPHNCSRTPQWSSHKLLSWSLQLAVNLQPYDCYGVHALVITPMFQPACCQRSVANPFILHTYRLIQGGQVQVQGALRASKPFCSWPNIFSWTFSLISPSKSWQRRCFRLEAELLYEK